MDLHDAQCAIFTPEDAEFAGDAIAAESRANIMTMIVHDVDVKLLRRNILHGDVQNWQDRRRDIYKVVYLQDPQSYDILGVGYASEVA